MYLIDKEKPLTTEILKNILMDFQTSELPRLNKLDNYYHGRHKILYKTAPDKEKKYNKVVTNFCHYITETYLGYLTGIPISYNNDNFEQILNILKYNDYKTEDNELLRQALIYGRSFEINYVDENSVQRFRMLDTKNCIPVYENTLTNDLQYVIRFWSEQLEANISKQEYIVEVYGPESIVRYRSTEGFSSFDLISEEKHYYGQCPVSVFSLNKDEMGIFEQIISLQDAYNEVVSGSIDDFDSFADCYLILKGMDAEEEDLADMKRNRVMLLDPDADASYLTKNINDSQIMNLITNLKENIHKIANCPDFTDPNFMSQSGIAIKYKLVGMETTAASIEEAMHLVLQRRIELITQILSLTGSDDTWRDVNITFTRNLPVDLENIVTIVNSLRGLVSDETLLGLIPFVTDVNAELEKVKAQKESNIDLFSLGTTTEEDGDENE